MKANFTKKQYKTLLKIVYLGNWMVNAIRNQDEQIKEFEEKEHSLFRC